MPLTRCQEDGKQGWKWGDEGKCYTYTSPAGEAGAKAAALRQGRAVEANKAMGWIFKAYATLIGKREEIEESLLKTADELAEGMQSLQALHEVQAMQQELPAESVLPAEPTLAEKHTEGHFHTIGKILTKSADAQERIVYGVVMEPTAAGELNYVTRSFDGTVWGMDTYEEYTSEQEIRRAMIAFMEAQAAVGAQAAPPHNIAHQPVIAHTAIIENYQAPMDMELGGQKIYKGTWIQAVKVYDDELWKALADGVITGYSIEGRARIAPSGDLSAARSAG